MQRSVNHLAVLLALLAACAAGTCLAEAPTPDASAQAPSAAAPAGLQDDTEAAPAARPAPPSLAARLLQRGRASWYAHRLHGRRTASGEPYDRHALTAAHPTLPLSSYARVRNPANGREVVVRINDRGPFGRGHVIDVSHAAATLLGILRGSREVEIEPVADGRRRAGSAPQERAATPQAPQTALPMPSGPAS